MDNLQDRNCPKFLPLFGMKELIDLKFLLLSITNCMYPLRLNFLCDELVDDKRNISNTLNMTELIIFNYELI